MNDWLLYWISADIPTDHGSGPLRPSTPAVASVYTPVLSQKYPNVSQYVQLAAVLFFVDAPAPRFCCEARACYRDAVDEVFEVYERVTSLLFERQFCKRHTKIKIGTTISSSAWGSPLWTKTHMHAYLQS